MAAQEPAKTVLLAFRANGGMPPKREAFCIVQAFPLAPVIEAIVDLSGDEGMVTSWTQVLPNSNHSHLSEALSDVQWTFWLAPFWGKESVIEVGAILGL